MVQCLRNGVGKRLSRCARLPRTVGTVVLGRPEAAGEKNRPSTCPPRDGRVYTSNRWKPKKEISA